MNFLIRLVLPAIMCSGFLVHAAEPIISNVLPRGGQAGSEMEVTISGNRLKDSKEIFFYGKGITAFDVNATNDKSVQAKFKISKDAELGQHELRLRAKSGISTLKTF
ncbi:MAG: peptidase, partial [Opitutae bacterium]|nr:peptidase [Opitutae bacterium]